jgi:hypothetical protein
MVSWSATASKTDMLINNQSKKLECLSIQYQQFCTVYSKRILRTSHSPVLPRLANVGYSAVLASAAPGPWHAVEMMPETSRSLPMRPPG